MEFEAPATLPHQAGQRVVSYLYCVATLSTRARVIHSVRDCYHATQELPDIIFTTVAAPLVEACAFLVCPKLWSILMRIDVELRVVHGYLSRIGHQLTFFYCHLDRLALVLLEYVVQIFRTTPFPLTLLEILLTQRNEAQPLGVRL